MNVLVACEESQRVCIEFRKLGHRAFSCDIQDQTGGHPEWHICSDVLPLINGDCKFQTQDGKPHEQVGRWDMLIAFPPCTYLTISGNRWFNEERYGEQARRCSTKQHTQTAYLSVNGRRSVGMIILGSGRRDKYEICC